MASTVTAEQRKAAVGMVAAMAETIRAVGSVPSGELYARVMSTMDLPTYDRIIGILKGAGLVAERANELAWVGPTLPQAVRQ